MTCQDVKILARKYVLADKLQELNWDSDMVQIIILSFHSCRDFAILYDPDALHRKTWWADSNSSGMATMAL